MDNQYNVKELAGRLESVFINILSTRPEDRAILIDNNHLDDIKNILNKIFENRIECKDILYTYNTDKPFFGIHINPKINNSQAISILVADEDLTNIYYGSYQLELDSKLFDIDLSCKEITSLILFEISSMLDSYDTIGKVKALIDLEILSIDDVVSIRNSVNYCQFAIYAIKDTLYKVSSFMFKQDPEELTSNKLIQAAELEEAVLSAQGKITSSDYGTGDGVREPKTIILHWFFTTYKDIKFNSSIIKDSLTDAKSFTGSKLLKMEIDKTIAAIDRIYVSPTNESVSINRVLESKNLHSINELSLFKSLKANGLRSIEDALYEFTLRIKNCDTEEDAMYILRGINTRLNILEDYLYNTPDLSEYDRKHWESVVREYRKLREVLAKKKIVNKKQYGLFFDYDQLDYLDQNNNQSDNY